TMIVTTAESNAQFAALAGAGRARRKQEAPKMPRDEGYTPSPAEWAALAGAGRARRKEGAPKESSEAGLAEWAAYAGAGRTSARRGVPSVPSKQKTGKPYHTCCPKQIFTSGRVLVQQKPPQIRGQAKVNLRPLLVLRVPVVLLRRVSTSSMLNPYF
ncbi:hypothetical protein H0H81_001532, partial [Sphagnurus paluster]